MHMLPAITPQPRSEAHAAGKASNTSSDDTFGQVLNRRSASVKTSGPAKSTKPSEEKPERASADGPNHDDQAILATLLGLGSSSAPLSQNEDGQSVVRTDTVGKNDPTGISPDSGTENAPIFPSGSKKTGTISAEALSADSEPAEQLKRSELQQPAPAGQARTARQTATSAQGALAQASQQALLQTNGQASGTMSSSRRSETLGDSHFAQLVGSVNKLNRTTQDATATDAAGANDNQEPLTQKGLDKSAARQGLPENLKSVPPSGEAAVNAKSGADSLSGFEGNMQKATAEPSEDAALEILEGAGPRQEATATGSQIDPHSAMSTVRASATAPSQPNEVVRTSHMPSTEGTVLPDHEVVEQILQGSSLRELEGKRHLTVELHPEELGQVKLELVQEKDRLQLHLQAQSSEVRDILEKHLPRLQETLQHQGLRLENIQVSVDAQRNNSQGFFERQQQQGHRSPWQQATQGSLRAEEQPVAARPDGRASASGLSLRI
jgi:flagellar hook-length control protein FliK